MKHSLRLASIKSAMLLALTRPSRSMDLSKLDIRDHSYTTSGVVFKAQHLSKQSRPLKISFTQGFQNTLCCAQS